MTEASAKYAIAAYAKEYQGDRYFFATLVQCGEGPTYLLLTSSLKDGPDAFHDLDCISRYPDDIQKRLVDQLKANGYSKYVFPNSTSMARQLACSVYNAKPPHGAGQRHMPPHKTKAVDNPSLAG